MASAQKPIMTAAMRHLSKTGIEALRPQRLSDTSLRWRRPLVSRRKAADLRKASISEGTFGSFNPETGKGWDPQWDIEVYNARGNIPSIRRPKRHKRERNRENRAVKIESLLSEADDKIESYRKDMKEKKPDKGVETLFKRLMRGGNLK
eukprot:CAMPEP_0197833854 /NCGR_PEP_ID=MMETSP1437-20131217/20335_1 /TAXON_ID=49252 ORGANISM="Eucampia antarctica, Strain CCMP1452" /NCGR_SAMPLE_ID=MMETSP1437 /ASSEMBLY_ACC=CAM_ASM_001096 /LENGTH=148 /DNA_ID=CAMNT_0043438147 /DNA_START=167 /DNA_END=613 /DNA_ORIENTATION=-